MSFHFLSSLFLTFGRAHSGPGSELYLQDAEAKNIGSLEIVSDGVSDLITKRHINPRITHFRLWLSTRVVPKRQ